MYLDSSIIVKLLVVEKDSAQFAEATFNETLVSSELAYTEVSAALYSKERIKKISADEHRHAWLQFLSWVDGEDFLLHPMNLRVLKNANRILSATHPAVALRTLDAIHLAACDLSQDFPLCTTDRRMREAADILNIPVFPESLPPA